jgi:hypothetical protein
MSRERVRYIYYPVYSPNGAATGGLFFIILRLFWALRKPYCILMAPFWLAFVSGICFGMLPVDTQAGLVHMVNPTYNWKAKVARDQKEKDIQKAKDERVLNWRRSF